MFTNALRVAVSDGENLESPCTNYQDTSLTRPPKAPPTVGPP